jgi:hypothetical protein
MNVISRWCKINRAPVLSLRLLIGQPYMVQPLIPLFCTPHLTTHYGIPRYGDLIIITWGTLQAVERTLFALSGKD